MLTMFLRFSNFLEFLTKSPVVNPSLTRRSTFFGFAESIVLLRAYNTSCSCIALEVSVVLLNAVSDHIIMGYLIVWARARALKVATKKIIEKEVFIFNNFQTN